MCLFVMCMSWSDPTKVCLVFLKVLLMPNCQVQKYNVPHNPSLHNELNKMCWIIFVFSFFCLVKHCSIQFHSGTGLWFHTGPLHGIIFGICCVFKLKNKNFNFYLKEICFNIKSKKEISSLCTVLITFQTPCFGWHGGLWRGDKSAACTMGLPSK